MGPNMYEADVEPVELTYQTGDVPLVAYLTMMKFTAVGPKPSAAMRNVLDWSFEDTDELREQVEIYTFHEAQVDPFAYSKILSTLYRDLNSAKGRAGRKR